MRRRRVQRVVDKVGHQRRKAPVVPAVLVQVADRHRAVAEPARQRRLVWSRCTAPGAAPTDLKRYPRSIQRNTVRASGESSSHKRQAATWIRTLSATNSAGLKQSAAKRASTQGAVRSRMAPGTLLSQKQASHMHQQGFPAPCAGLLGAVAEVDADGGDAVVTLTLTVTLGLSPCANAACKIAAGGVPRTRTSDVKKWVRACEQRMSRRCALRSETSSTTPPASG